MAVTYTTAAIVKKIYFFDSLKFVKLPSNLECNIGGDKIWQ